MSPPGVVVRLPALPAAIAAAGIATAGVTGVVPPAAVAVALTALTALLALCSADPLRRLAWSAGAVAAVLTAVSLLAGPLSGWLPALPDPTGLRTALGEPLDRKSVV